MPEGPLVFSQVLRHLPVRQFHACVDRYDGNRYVKQFSCLDQYRCMAFAQLTCRESLRDIEVCLRAQSSKLYHMGIRSPVSKSTLADANEKRDWRIYADLAVGLIDQARTLYADEAFGVDLQNTVYALDASTIDLCLSVFPWAHFRSTKAAVRLHALLDLRGNIPSFIHITDGSVHEVNVLDILIFEPGAFYVMDRGYTDFARLFAMDQAGAFFIIRAKKNLRCKRRYSHQVDKTTGIICDQTILLTGVNSQADYPNPLRRIKYRDTENNQTYVFLTNHFNLPAKTIADLYKQRWQIELFFKWIKQHLRIKSFFGTSENAVKTQIWIAVSVYLIIAILKKQQKLEPSLYTILQILSVSCFERLPLNQILNQPQLQNLNLQNSNQLNLFSY